MDRPRILLVDDDPKIVHLVREVLLATGYDVLTTCNGDHAVQSVALEKPDLVILDLVLPGGTDGYEVARRVRAFSSVPIIMLTAKVKENDVLAGFDSGADDYLTKPFSCKELLARMRALLKRATTGETPAPPRDQPCPDVTIDHARRKVAVRGRDVHLTPIEYRLLCELSAHCNQVLEHEQLLSAVWGSAYRNDNDYLRAYIHNLRQKIEEDPENPKIIVRCPGVGYMLAG